MNKNDLVANLITTNDNKYYIAVDDVTCWRGKKDDMVREVENLGFPIEQQNLPHDYRHITKKFVNNPIKAILNVLANFVYDRDLSYDKKFIDYVLKNLKYDETSKCYTIDTYETIGTRLPPKESHWEKFNKGEYVLIKNHHEIQLLSTTPETFDLEGAKKTFFSQN